ncbi:MAG: Hsp20/alpha crystallin family protein [Proteobacteria bacterium]|nr:Hsp20/alpha crystallin family protein [Pseudomonadota bacterium]
MLVPWYRTRSLNSPFFGFVNRLDTPYGVQRFVHSPTLGIQDKGETFEISGELPGLEPSDLEVRVLPDRVEISAHREIKAREGYEVNRRERRDWRFSRAFRLPQPVHVDDAVAEMKNGVFTLRLPKREEVLPRQIEVKSA